MSAPPLQPSLLQRVDASTWIAIGGLIIGWFTLPTLTGDFGPIHQMAHFFDLPAIMKTPSRLLTGVGSARAFGTVAFGVICLLTAMAPILARREVPRLAWLLHSAPLILMVVCAIVLYIKTSSAHIEPGQGMGRFGGYVARWANGVTDWSGDVVARHISIGAGAYLSLATSLWLAVKGVRQLRLPAAAVTSSPPP